MFRGDAASMRSHDVVLAFRPFFASLSALSVLDLKKNAQEAYLKSVQLNAKERKKEYVDIC